MHPSRHLPYMAKSANQTATCMALLVMTIWGIGTPIGACLDSPGGPRVDSVSHFLSRCLEDDDCGKGLSCLCSVCTIPCETSEVCGTLGGECISSAARTCLGDTESGLCGSECEDDNECSGGVCQSGLCVARSSCDPKELEREGAVVVEVVGGGPLVEGSVAHCAAPLHSLCDTSVKWYVDNISVGEKETLDSGFFDKGQVLTCSMGLDGVSATSAAVLVENTPPVVSGVTVGPSLALPDEFFRCEVDSWNDPDPADSVPNFDYAWFWKSPDGEGIFDGQSENALEAWRAPSSAQVFCRVTPRDSESQGKPVDSESAILDCNSFVMAASFAGNQVFRKAYRGQISSEYDLRLGLSGVGAEAANARVDNLRVSDASGSPLAEDDMTRSELWELCGETGGEYQVDGELRANASWQVFSPRKMFSGWSAPLKVAFDLTWSASTSNLEVGLESPDTQMCGEDLAARANGVWFNFDTFRHRNSSGQPSVEGVHEGVSARRAWGIPGAGTYQVEAIIWPSCGVKDQVTLGCLMAEASPSREVCNQRDDNCDGNIDEGLCGCDPGTEVIWTERFSASLETRLSVAELAQGAWNNQQVTNFEGRTCLLQSSDWNYAFIPVERGSGRFQAVEAELFWPGREGTAWTLFGYGTRVGLNFLTDALRFGVRSGQLWGLVGGATEPGLEVRATGVTSQIAGVWTKVRLELDRECLTARILVGDKQWARDIPIEPSWIEGGSIGLGAFGEAPTVSPDVCWSNLRVFEGNYL